MESNPFKAGYKPTSANYSGGSLYEGAFFPSGKAAPFDIVLKHLKAGNDSIRIITTSGGANCPDTTNYISIQVNGPQAGFILANPSVCLSDNVKLIDTSTAQIGSIIKSWTWFYGDGTSDTLTTGGNALHRYTNTGVFNVKLVVSDSNHCTDTAYWAGANLTIKGPKANFRAEQNPILPNVNELFTNLTDSGYAGRINNRYSWAFGDGKYSNASDDKILHVYKEYSDDTVKLIATSSETMCADTAASVIRVKNTALHFTYTTSFVNKNSACPPVLASFENTSTNFDIVSWNFGDGLMADNINTPSHTYYKPGRYKVTIYGYYDATTYDSTWEYITIAGPTAVLQADVLTGCGSRQVIFTAQTENAASMFWDFGDGFTSTDSVVTHTYTSPNLYTPSLTLTNRAKCSYSYYLANPIAIDSLSVSINHDSISQCHQLLEKFTPQTYSIAKNNGEKIDYTWLFDSNGDTTNGDSASFVYTAAGTYQVSVIAKSPYGCTDTATAEISFVSVSSVAISGPAEFCESTPVAFKAINNSGSNTSVYHWQFQDSTSSQQNPPPQSFTSRGSDTIILMVDNEGCKDTVYQKITVHQQPDVTMLMSDSIVCLGTGITFNSLPNDVTSQESIRYFWNLGVGNGKDTATVQSATFVYPAFGTYLVTLTASSIYGCAEQLRATAVVTPSPVTTIKAPIDVCLGTPAVYTGYSTVTGAKYVWHFPDNTTDSANRPLLKRYSSAGAKEAYLVTSVGNCSDTAFHSLTVHTTPIADIIPQTAKICLNDSIQLVAHNGKNYHWVDAAYITSSSVADPYVFPVTDTKYKVELTDAYGCKGTDSVTVFVTKPKKIKVVSPVNVCTGSVAKLTASGTDTYNWLNGGDLNYNNISAPATKTAAQTKNYIVVGSDTAGCFHDTSRIEVIVREKPEVDAGNDVVAPAGIPVQLSASSPSHITQWSWQPAINLLCTDCASPVSKPRQTTRYTVEATDNYGCKATDSVLVTVVCKESLVSIPEVFTPNADGKNDRFRIAGYGIKSITHFVIFGRNGNKVFERNNVSPLDTDASWDGMCNNVYMPAGTYIYIIQAVCDAGEVYNLKGTVTLVR